MFTTADKVLASIFTIALVAVLVSQHSKTTDAVTAFASMLTSLISTIMSPLAAAQKASNDANNPLGAGQALIGNTQPYANSLLASGNSLIGKSN